MAEHIQVPAGPIRANGSAQHFVALGGPFLGSVTLLQAVMVDGTFPPLDMLFTESQMLSILREPAWPVGASHARAQALFR